MTATRPGFDAPTMKLSLETGTALVAFDEDMTIVQWNRAAEELTGFAKREAVGQPLWAVLGGRDDSGGLVCHPRCSRGRLIREGRPVKTLTMSIRCTGGWRRVALDTISVVGNDRPIFAHLMHAAPAPAVADDERQPDYRPLPHLTPRQLDVLRLLDQGAPARAIAAKLGLSEATVRNHIRALLLELRAHSQLEAVSRARCHGLL